MFYPKIIIKKISSESDNIDNIKKGEIVHFIMSKIKSKEDIKNLDEITLKAISYFGEKFYKWNIEKDFINPIKNIVDHPKLKNIMFIKDAKNFSERDIIIPLNNSYKTIRPDKVIISKQEVYVLEFKSEYSEDGYKKNIAQLREYIFYLKKMFKKPVLGFLVYIFSNKVVEARGWDQ